MRAAGADSRSDELPGSSGPGPSTWPAPERVTQAATLLILGSREDWAAARDLLRQALTSQDASSTGLSSARRDSSLWSVWPCSSSSLATTGRTATLPPDARPFGHSSAGDDVEKIRKGRPACTRALARRGPAARPRSPWRPSPGPTRTRTSCPGASPSSASPSTEPAIRTRRSKCSTAASSGSRAPRSRSPLFPCRPWPSPASAGAKRRRSAWMGSSGC